MSDLLRLLRLWRPALPWLAAALLMSTATTLAHLALMATAGWFVTAMAAAGLAGASLNYFTPSAIIRFAAIVRTGGRWLDRVVGHETTFRLLAATRTALFRRLEAIAPAGLEDLRSAEVAARLKLDVDRLELVFLRLVAPLAVAAVVAGVVVAATAGVAGAGLAATVGGIFVVGVAVVPFAAAAGAAAAAAREGATAGLLRRRLLEQFEGLSTLLATGDERRRAAAIEALFAARIDDERRVASRAAIGQIGQGLAGDAAVIAVLLFGARATTAGGLDGPGLTLVLLLVQAAAEAFAPIPAAAAGFAATSAALRRLFALWDRVPAVAEPADPVAPPSSFDLVCDGVSFTRPGRRRPVLEDVDLSLPEGAERVVSGPSGVGKSTLIDLLVRVRDPDRGEIRLGGVRLADLATVDLRARIALVPQRPHIFAASIAENLRAVAPAASEADLWTALDRVGLGATVAAMPSGLATFVGEGGRSLSGGEARRLAVARALLRPEARIVILDEPTEGLDAATAAATMRAVRAACAGRSLLVVSHRRDGAAILDGPSAGLRVTAPVPETDGAPPVAAP